MSESKKPTKIKVSKKLLKQVSGIRAGHRDAAERLSTDYYLIMTALKQEPMPEIMDMDVFTEILEGVEPQEFLTFLHSQFGQGFLMGMIHQTLIYQSVADEDSGSSESGED